MPCLIINLTYCNTGLSRFITNLTFIMWLTHELKPISMVSEIRCKLYVGGRSMVIYFTIYLFSKNIGTHQSFLYGHWYIPLLWTQGNVCPGSQSQGGSLTCALLPVCNWFLESIFSNILVNLWCHTYFTSCLLPVRSVGFVAGWSVTPHAVAVVTTVRAGGRQVPTWLLRGCHVILVPRWTGRCS